jgi:putative transposase
VAFIDEHRCRFGVEPICRVLSEHGCKIAPNTYWVFKKRARSARSIRDEQLSAEIVRVYEENLLVDGADKIWAQLNREGIRVARCTVERLMKAQGLSGASGPRPSPSQRAPMTVSSCRQISSTGSSERRPRTRCGSPI